MAISRENLIGKILVEKKVISAEELQETLLTQKDSSQKLGQILIKKGLASEKDILHSLSEYYGISSQVHIEFDDPDNFFSEVPVNFLKRHRMVPFKKTTNKIFVAVDDPLKIQPFDDLKMMFPGHELEAVLTTEEEIKKIINLHYDTLKAESTDDVIEDLEESDFEILTSHISETEDIMDMANDAPIIRLVNTIIKQAVNERTSDIHFEPYEKDLSVRFRIDGMLYQMFTPPKNIRGPSPQGSKSWRT